ncbi:DNA alkylation repair protein [Gordonia sp. 852002-50816_SCH5313054-c]|uniref:DNA alkylation repair protein n=1 Tax=unclassified Gordonia (in: high G+C Gram-positive bacteria) TaxID=2657482 RepID=UPI0007EA232E|nr:MULTISPECIES: DNA alkylation repair protein [unclassified Gordonia (in: high G+C Gram-positive bacteria)]OBC12506.1 DNA alkylation repair protein [Gordonia sp. 852002-50816_SCH5313054-a]OBC19507.1 DNA alkylation repair protein [Gordonia sp. 852002-50816_SCH5313054-c]
MSPRTAGAGGSADNVIAAIDELADPERATSMASYFQAHPGGYGGDDEFLGVRVPQLRAIAKRFRGISRGEVRTLLTSRFHEVRLAGLFCARDGFDRADAAEADLWVADYLAAVAAGAVNNWDLVDSSADPILGEWSWQHGDVDVLVDFAARDDLWERRIGIIGTFAWIKHGDAQALAAVAPLVIDDRRPLIQKAFGWMLREMGKRVDAAALTSYLDDHAAHMGRTALGYAVEHLDPEARAHYRSLR